MEGIEETPTITRTTSDALNFTPGTLNKLITHTTTTTILLRANINTNI